MNDNYIKALEKQCQDWEKMYIDMKAERDAWKERYTMMADEKDKRNNLSDAPKKQLRHV